MPTINRWKHFRRAYAILTVFWIVYLVLIVPIQLRHRAETRLGERMANCTHLTADHKITYDGECMDLAEHLYVIDKSAAGHFFTPAGLTVLIVAALGMPLALYYAMAVPAGLLRRQGPPAASPRNNTA